MFYRFIINILLFIIIFIITKFFVIKILSRIIINKIKEI